MAKKVEITEDVVKDAIVKVSRERYNRDLDNMDDLGKKHKLSEAVIFDMKEEYKKSHMIKGTKVDTHLIRLSNMDKQKKEYLTGVAESLDEFNLLLITEGVTLPKRKRGETIEYDAQPQLKLVCELIDMDTPTSNNEEAVS